MSEHLEQAKRWNLFARELEDILASYNLGLGHLDDRDGIHREKVRRLIQSLRAPKSFPVLNTEEMDLLVQTLQLGDEEVLRLRAALLATAIERTLMDRINQDEALLAAEQAFPLILKALHEQASRISGLGAVRGDDGGPGADDELETLFDTIWDTMDDAEMALQLSYRVDKQSERVAKARLARARFEEALADLEGSGDHIRALHFWKDCYDATKRGLAATCERLEDLSA